MSRPWLRLYSAMPLDPKVRQLSTAECWVWVCCLCAAGSSPQPGVLLISDQVPFDGASLADLARVKTRVVESALAKLEAVGMLAREGNAWRVVAWESRQYESDVSTERVRRLRARRGDAPQHHADATSEVAPAPRRASSEPSVSEFESDFESVWRCYPRKTGRQAALRAYAARRRAGASADDLLAAAENYAVSVAGREPQFIKLASTFFGPDEHFNDFLLPDETRPYVTKTGIHYPEPKIIDL